MSKRPTADDLAGMLDDLLADIPPYHSYQHERELWEKTQERAELMLQRYNEGEDA